MPNIQAIPVPIFGPLTPYHHLADQAPIDALIARIDLVNGQVDNDANTLLESIGTAGSLANRLSQSINDDGSIKTIAIDNALHHIAEHMDGGGYVRMTTQERAKLSLIADEATHCGIRFNTISGIIGFDQGFLDVQPSDTITWRYTNGSMFADNAFPSSVRHVHYYDVIPVLVNLITPDYINYKTTSVATPYRSGSLRIYLNGFRISMNALINVPNFDNSSFVSYTFSEDTSSLSDGIITSGLFSLSPAIDADMNILIDFDIIY